MEDNRMLVCEMCECECEEMDLYDLDGSQLCEKCFDERVETCECCGEEHDRDMMNEIDDVYVCNDCYDYNTMTCEICGEVHLSDDMVEIPNHRDEDVVVCQSCMERYSFYCNYHDREEIDTTSYNDGTVEVCNYGIVCIDGYEWGDFTCCPSCEDIYHIDDMIYVDHEEEYYCECCAEEHSLGHIESYHNHDYYEKFTSEEDTDDEEDTLFFGFELEVEKKENSPTDRAEMSEILYNLDEDDVLVYETDGSLNDGFEIISKPMTFNYIVENKDFFNEMINKLEDNKYQSYATNTCGHHIHISKSPFTTRQIELFVAIFEYYKEEFTTLSRRNRSKLDRWASFKSEDLDKEDLDNARIFENVIENCMLNRDKYSAVNLRHNSTIEIRIWRGTLNKLEFLARLELLNNICLYIFENEEMLENMVYGDDSLSNLNLFDIITYKTDMFVQRYLESKDFMEVVTKYMATI